MVHVDITVTVPGYIADSATGRVRAGREDLDEANTSLDHPSGNETLSTIVLRLFAIQAVHFLDVLRLLLQIERLGSRCLHAKGQFK